MATLRDRLNSSGLLMWEESGDHDGWESSMPVCGGDYEQSIEYQIFLLKEGLNQWNRGKRNWKAERKEYRIKIESNLHKFKGLMISNWPVCGRTGFSWRANMHIIWYSYSGRKFQSVPYKYKCINESINAYTLCPSNFTSSYTIIYACEEEGMIKNLTIALLIFKH